MNTETQLQKTIRVVIELNELCRALLLAAALSETETEVLTPKRKYTKRTEVFPVRKKRKYTRRKK